MHTRSGGSSLHVPRSSFGRHAVTPFPHPPSKNFSASGLRAEFRSTPIIFVTASKEPALRQRAMEMRIAGLIDKPYDPEELLGIARFALGENGSLPGPPPLPSPQDNPTIRPCRFDRPGEIQIPDDYPPR